MLFIQRVFSRPTGLTPTRCDAPLANCFAPSITTVIVSRSRTLGSWKPVAVAFLVAETAALSGLTPWPAPLPAHAKKARHTSSTKPTPIPMPAASAPISATPGAVPPGVTTAATIATTSIPTSAVAASGLPITISINGKTITADPPPVMVGGSLLVPLRGVLENMGATVNFDPQAGRIQVAQGANHVTLRIGQNSAAVGTKSVNLTAAPRLIGNRAFVPLRSLAELFGYSVNWTPATRLVAISNTGPRTYADHRAALRAGGPFGVTIDFRNTTDTEVEQLLDTAKKAGAGIIQTRFDWATLEPTKGTSFQWPTYDRVVRAARQRNLVVVGILGDAAPWATVFSNGANADAGDLLYGAPRESNYPAWQNYVKRTVGRYRNDVHAWQVWDNPESDKFRSVPRVYRQIVGLAVESAHLADSKAVIHAAEPGGVNLSFIDELKGDGLLPKLDGVSLFPISQQQPGVPAAPEDFLLPFATLRERLADSNALRDAWIGGLTWPVLAAAPNGSAPPSQFATQDAALRERLLKTFTPQAQADYLMRSTTLALASGVGKIFWGALRDAATYERVEPINPEYDAGLVTQDFTPRPSFAAFQTLSRLVSDKPFVGPLTLGPKVVALVFDNQQQTNVAAWAVEGQAKLSLNTAGNDPKLPGSTYIQTLPGSQVLDAGGAVLGGAEGTFNLTNRPVWITNVAVPTRNAARDKSGGKPLHMAPRQMDYSTGPAVSVNFAETGGEKGLAWRKYANFRGMARKLIEMDGKSGLVTEISRDIYNPGAGKPFIFVDVADSYMYFARGAAVTVNVEVHRTKAENSIFGARTGGFNLQYDSTTGLKFTNWQEVETGTGWATYTFKIPDASFANRDGFDFKINTLGSKQDLVFSSITLQRDNNRQAAPPAALTGQTASAPTPDTPTPAAQPAITQAPATEPKSTELATPALGPNTPASVAQKPADQTPVAQIPVP